MMGMQTLTLAAVTRRGQALVFEHKLNGKLKKPLKPKTVVQAATSSNKDEVPVPVPILAALPKDEDGPGLLVAHGSFLKPKFEKVVKTPDLSSGSTVMYPGQMAPQGPSMEPARRKRKPSASELTLEERLNAISVDKPDQSPRKPPKADTLVNLLTQGLQSKDGKILTNVLQERNERIIANTIKRLPVQVVIPLVKELSQRMHGHAQR
nr:hypothetical protein BaRGS_020182 [Batillaria attramentaria]